ncbi:MAG: hypothetical protein IJT70_03980 [Clostridia bacterium]|nr:hypothetical protein [Clostridia bacterium]
MPNRIKDIFTNEMFDMSAHLRFRDGDAYKGFLAALDSVQEEGCVVPVDGVIAISTEIKQQGTTYPVEEQTNISHFVVGPSFEPFTFPLQVGEQEKGMILWRNIAKNKIIIKTNDDAIVFFQFTFIPNENRHTINYKIQFEKATTIEEVAESYCLANALLTKLYRSEAPHVDKQEAITIIDVKNYFRYHESFLRRLLAIEKLLDLSISPKLLKDLSREQQQDIDELYLLLVLHKTVKLNGKLTSTESTSITVKEGSSSSVVGSAIEMTFSGTIDYDFWGQSLKLYTANLLTNAIVKEIHEEADGKIKLLYGDTDSKPMYISFSAFRTQEEASAELKTIMNQKKDTYLDAQTSASFIEEFYSE